MSFRLFIYYCALCGGWAAFFGWIFGQFISLDKGNPFLYCLDTGLNGMFLGLFVALGLGLIDALWNLSLGQTGQIIMRVGVAVVVGMVGGMLGGGLGQAVYNLLPSMAGINNVGLLFGWVLTGFLIGMSVAFFELLMNVSRGREVRGAMKKMVKAFSGGAVGGFLGGVLYILLDGSLRSIFTGQDRLWSPSAWGFVALGMCIGLLIGLAQVFLKEAWVKVEAGFRPGREKILTKERNTIGRAEACDIGLFGDPGTEKLHAIISQMGRQYYLDDNGSPGGTFLNDNRISQRTPLKNGDLIRVGKNILRFQERRKR